MTILPQEVWFADFPFIDDPTQSKDRPRLTLQARTAKIMAVELPFFLVNELGYRARISRTCGILKS